MKTDELYDVMTSLTLKYKEVRKELSRIIVGQHSLIEGIFIAILCNGHVLLEGVPGLGKTSLVRAFGKILDVSVSRIQFTPDLMPADIIGTTMVSQDESNKRYFDFHKGPLFAHFVLADEINRATPKTQSALLEAMQEQSVTTGGTTHKLESPFTVLATQNPIELEGTYPLPEAQLDRFFSKLIVPYPDFTALKEIMTKTTESEAVVLRKIMDKDYINKTKSYIHQVPVASHVKEYVIRLILATQPESQFATEKVKKYVRYGSSPRGGQSILMAAKVKALFDSRYNVSFNDIRETVFPALRHRILLNFEGEAEGISSDDIIEDILGTTPEVIE
ncbi:MAG: MoxR family ATPase [Spirochaetales bacterium]|nr:MoxR family ATPase [Spirochaetales bacterium]